MIILLAVDGSDLALDAVRFGLRLVAEGLQARFVLAHVQPATQFYELVLAPDVELIEAASQAAGAHALASARALLDAAGVSFETEIGSGDAALTLIDIADRYNCDAILMGTHGSGWLASTRLGRVALSVLQHATIPVSIVRHAEAETEDELADGGPA